jgi:hypothetical protein
MRTVRNITVAVEPELYRQTRRIAADYDTTVTDMVRFLLLVLPEAVKSARYPGGRPQFGLAAARADRAAASAPPAIPSAAPATTPGGGRPPPPPAKVRKRLVRSLAPPHNSIGNPPPGRSMSR